MVKRYHVIDLIILVYSAFSGRSVKTLHIPQIELHVAANSK